MRLLWQQQPSGAATQPGGGGRPLGQPPQDTAAVPDEKPGSS